MPTAHEKITTQHGEYEVHSNNTNRLYVSSLYNETVTERGRPYTFSGYFFNNYREWDVERESNGSIIAWVHHAEVFSGKLAVKAEPFTTNNLVLELIPAVNEWVKNNPEFFTELKELEKQEAIRAAESRRDNAYKEIEAANEELSRLLDED